MNENTLLGMQMDKSALERRAGIAQRSMSSAQTEIADIENIIKKGEAYFIEMAVAGHKQSDIEIEIEDNTLRISATYGDRDDDIEFVHKGISERGFYKSFALAEYVEVKKAKMSDGILVIELEKNIPEEQKPKKIKISR